MSCFMIDFDFIANTNKSYIDSITQAFIVIRDKQLETSLSD